MFCILPGIARLEDYATAILTYRPARCPHCQGRHIIRHGYYQRQAERDPKYARATNPVAIARFLCKGCQRTFSVLPECLSPRRWYNWAVQMDALLASLLGESLRKTAKKLPPHRRTLRRWRTQITQHFHFFADTLKQHIPRLRKCVDFSAFWSECLSQIHLSSAMLLCHEAGLIVP